MRVNCDSNWDKSGFWTEMFRHMRVPALIGSMTVMETCFISQCHSPKPTEFGVVLEEAKRSVSTEKVCTCCGLAPWNPEILIHVPSSSLTEQTRLIVITLLSPGYIVDCDPLRHIQWTGSIPMSLPIQQQVLVHSIVGLVSSEQLQTVFHNVCPNAR